MVAMKDQSGAAYAVGHLTGWEPLGFEAGDNNWYRFVANGPTQKTDPSGKGIIDEADTRRGHGPWLDSAQHCWAACYFGAVYGVGNMTAVIADVAEVLEPSEDWWRDIKAQHVGGWAGNAFNWQYIFGCHKEAPELYCDKVCETWA